MTETQSKSVANRWTALAGMACIIGLFTWMATWTGGQDDAVGSRSLIAVETLIRSAALPLAWVIAAYGFGAMLQRHLVPACSEMGMRCALGVAAMLTLDSLLGTLGWLDAGNGIVAWAVIIIGWILTITRVLKSSLAHSQARKGISRWALSAHPLTWTAAPSIAVLLIAACSAPGWLWASEFGGYDALSYHLQLPREWLALGGVRPLHHNVYSFLPNAVESAFLHLMTMRGNAHTALLECQMLHALIALATAIAVADAARHVTGDRRLGAVAALAWLATPWVIVVGSLAYDEAAAALMLAALLRIALDGPSHCLGGMSGVAIGLLWAGAIGAKLPSAALIACPIAITLLLRLRWRQAVTLLCIATAVTIACLLPWLVRNWVVVGNPVFPFAAHWLGLGHWTPEQAAIWNSGHATTLSMPQRLGQLWSQYFAYGIGPNPSPREPWQPQWSIMPWLGLLGGMLALMRPRFHKTAVMVLLVLLVQIAAWLALTHVKSRFLLPTAVPLAVLIALGCAALTQSRSQRADRLASIILALCGIVLATVSMWLYRGEARGAPALAIDAVGVQTGDALSQSQRSELGSDSFPAIAINHLLPDNARVLLVGSATPLYMRLDRIAYCTTWNRGVLSEIMRRHADAPATSSADLRAAGFTHLLIDFTMLQVWERAGWNDPLLTPDRIRDFAETQARPLHRYPNDVTLYALP